MDPDVLSVFYDGLIQKSDSIFRSKLRLPRANNYEIMISNQEYQEDKIRCIYEYRNWQIRELGFDAVQINEFLRLIYGEYPNSLNRNGQRVKYEWVYNHLTGRNEKNRWNHVIETYHGYKQYGFFHWPPYHQELKWSTRLVTISCARMSSETMLKILRLQTLNVFNSFLVLERTVPKRRSLLFGQVWEFPIYKTVKETGLVTNYFISEC